jgi:hypothetical protein
MGKSVRYYKGRRIRPGTEKDSRPNEASFYLCKHRQTYLSEEIPPLVGFNLPRSPFSLLPSGVPGFFTSYSSNSCPLIPFKCPYTLSLYYLLSNLLVHI